MVVYKRQIEDVENYLQTAAGGGGGPQSASAPETLIKAMQKTHLAFVSLAGRYQPLHEAIQQQKSIYVQQYRQKHGTTDNPFFDRTAGVGPGRPGDAMPSNRVGPSPFTGKPDPVSMARAAALAHQSATTNQTGEILTILSISFVEGVFFAKVPFFLILPFYLEFSEKILKNL